MAKFYGAVGYATTLETKPGVWTERIAEQKYYGDIVKPYSRGLNNSERINDDITVSNQISILADQYALAHFFAIRFVEWMGSVWKVTNVEVQPPRLILTLGGVYNGPRAETT